MNHYKNIDTPETRFIFLHIPKTAGTMINEILRKNFPNRFYQDNLLYADIAYEPWHIKDAMRILPHTCFSSHALRASSIQDTLPYPNIAISFVRDPRKLAVSCYFDLKNRVAGEQHPVQNMALCELTEKWKATGFKQEYAFAVPQLKWLYPNKEQPLEQLTSDIAQNRLLLFPTDRFDEAMICLEKLFPNHFKDCSYGKRANVSQKDTELTSQDLDSLEEFPWISDDDQLVQQANMFLDKLINEIWPTKEQFQEAQLDFKNRCQFPKTHFQKVHQPSFIERVKRRIFRT